jgi:hypothetical protein
VKFLDAFWSNASASPHSPQLYPTTHNALDPVSIIRSIFCLSLPISKFAVYTSFSTFSRSVSKVSESVRPELEFAVCFVSGRCMEFMSGKRSNNCSRKQNKSRIYNRKLLSISFFRQRNLVPGVRVRVVTKKSTFF